MSCSSIELKQKATVTTSPTITATTTTTPTPSLTPAPIGSDQNPVLIGFVHSAEDESGRAAANDLSARLATLTGYTMDTRSYINYQELLFHMQQGDIDLAWLPPLTYLWAKQNGFAEAAFLTNNFGVYTYGSQFLAAVEDNYEVYFDPKTGENTADASVALQQLNDKRPCWVDPGSISGYILPVGLLNANGISYQEGLFTQEHTAVIRSLYIKNICDFGVTYTYTGDPRTASVLGDLPDVMERVVILWRSDPIIPTLNMSYLPEMPNGLRLNIDNAFVQIIKSEEGPSLLTKATGEDIEGLLRIDDSEYDDLREIIGQAGIELRFYIGK